MSQDPQDPASAANAGTPAGERPRLLALPNGEKSAPTFSRAEMDRRMKALRHHMIERAVDACLFTSIHNINYFADFVYCGFGRHYGLLVTGDTETTITANIDYGQPWRRGVPVNLVYTDWQRDNFFHAVKTLAVKGGCRRIGIEYDHVTLETRAKLEAALPKTEWIDIAPAAMRMRLFKSAEEQALIRSGAEVSDIGGAACVDAIVEGAPEYEVARHSTSTMVREIARRYPDTDLMDTWTWFQSGINTDGAHNPVTARRLRRGDILSLNCFAMISGYYHALERTLFLHSATDREVALWEANCRIHRRGLELIRPGARCKDIANELNEMYVREGLLAFRTFGYGHSFGTLCHYYGREAALELREDVETVLEPGMVVSMEPMITIPQGMPGAGGYREHDMLIVTQNGADNLTKFPFGPEHNIVRR